MLILTRKCHETVVIVGEDGVEIMLKVTVLAIKNGRVCLGFETKSEDVPVHREEVWNRISEDDFVGSARGTLNS